MEKHVGPVPFTEADARREATVMLEGKVVSCSPSLREGAFTCDTGCQKSGPDTVDITAHPTITRLVRAGVSRPGYMMYTYEVQAVCTRIRSCEPVPAQ